MAEMDAGELAESKGGSRAIRSAGAVLYRDHEALDAKLIAAANALHIVLPTHQTLQQTLTGDRLENEEGHLFDHDFTGSMISAHQSMVAATRSEIAHGSSATVVTLARQTLPVLIKHLKMMKADAASG